MTTITQNEQTFLRILRAALKNTQIAPADFPADTDWPALKKMALEHKVFPLLVCAIPPACLPNAQGSKRLAIEQVVCQTVRTTEFLDLYERMEAEGLHPLVVKGILCRGLYPQGDLRPSGDEDLYVTDAEFDRCRQFLRAFGMEPTNEDSPDAYEIGWRKTGTTLHIELHRRLFSPDSGAYRNLEAFFEPAVIQTAAYPTEYGKTVSSLCPHDHMLYLLLHAYKHFLHSGFGIRQVCDIGLWAVKYHDQIDWQALAVQCDRCSAQKFSAAVFAIARHYLDIPLELPEAWTASVADCEPLLRDILSGGVYGSADQSRQHSATVTLNAVESQRTGARRSIWNSVFPKRSHMEKQYLYLRKYPFLLPVAWAHRIIRYLTESRTNASNPAASLSIAGERLELLRMYGIIK